MNVKKKHVGKYKLENLAVMPITIGNAYFI